MNKILSWILVAVVVVGGGYAISKHKPEQKENMAVDQQAPAKKMSFAEFAKQGGSYKCEVKQAMSDFENSGTIYMNAGEMRGEFNSVAEGRKIDSSFIFKDGFMYSWSSAMPSMGFKMKANPTASNEEAAASGTYSWNTSEIGDYNCVAWSADPAEFELPAGVSFREIQGK